LEPGGTGVVLYVGSPGSMRVHWHLTRGDFEQAEASFPMDGSRPAAVLRLLRERPGGGADLVEELSLGVGLREGSGESGFAVPTDHGLYRAELGLTGGDGGWLMLVRSNRHYNAVGVGLELPAKPADAQAGQRPDRAREAPRASIPAGWEPPPLDAVGSQGAVAEPALGVGTSGPPGWDFPIAPIVRSLWTDAAPGGGALRDAVVQGSTGPMPGAVVPAPDAAAPVPVCADGGGLRWSPAADLLRAAPVLSLVEAIAAAPAARFQGAPAAPSSGAGLVARAEGAMPGDDDGARALTGAHPGIGVRIEPLTYERPPTRAMGLELEAELRIHGRATPNSTIDLFGYSYRVGPGGRFLLVLRVEDPELLRRALEEAPPPELSRGRDG
jgi:hypothetical protein